MTYRVGIFIGRFQPLHIGHQAIIEKMISEVDLPIVIIGSANSPSTILNPFSYTDRESLIKSIYPSLQILPINDYKYQDHLWLEKIKELIEPFEFINNKKSEIIIYGFPKDNSSDYLNWFPEYKHNYVKTNLNVSSTDIREIYFQYLNKENILNHEWNSVICKETIEFMQKFSETDVFKNLRKEFLYVKSYKEKSRYVGLEFPPIFNAVDSFVICSSHILLIRRNGALGYNKIALPGGFLNADETIISGIFRELKEETRINVPPAILQNSLKQIEIFDDPRRSTRGRTITYCGLIVLKEKTIPIVKGEDDAKEAFWLPINNLEKYQNEFFEDHYYIIQKMLNKL